MKNKIKPLIFFIVLTLIIGTLGAFLGDSSVYQNFNKPDFAPPGFLFPIVWTILYILMGISAALIYTSNTNKKDIKKSLFIYFSQLLVNSLWTLFFFRFEMYLFSFWWIIFLILLVILMIYNFYKINKKAAIIQIPYLLWISFAAILNYSIYLLN